MAGKRSHTTSIKPLALPLTRPLAQFTCFMQMVFPGTCIEEKDIARNSLVIFHARSRQNHAGIVLISCTTCGKMIA
jgi:hypothetical protein